jgi:hypothetical protein
MRYIQNNILNVINVITVTTNLLLTLLNGFYKPVSLWSSLFLGFIAIELTYSKALMTNNYINGKI